MMEQRKEFKVPDGTQKIEFTLLAADALVIRAALREKEVKSLGVSFGSEESQVVFLDSENFEIVIFPNGQGLIRVRWRESER